MPSVPKWLGNTMEVVFSGMYHSVRVSEVICLADDLKKIVMTGDFYKLKYTPGDVIEFRITETDFRHYTLSHFNPEKNICEMLVYLHDKGIGSEWAKGVQTGDQMKMIGPGGKIKYNFNHQRHFVFGDETSWSLFHAMKKAADERRHTCLCMAELDDIHRSWPGLCHFSIQVVEKSFDFPAHDATLQFSAMENSFWDEWRAESTFYLTGRAKSIQSVRKILVAKGISMKNIQTEPYWAEGKKGL